MRERRELAVQEGSAVVPGVFSAVRPGSVRPRGRWKRSLEVVADGWLRRIVEAKHPLYYSVFWERNTMDGEHGDVHAEWAGYVADAIIRLARLLPESWIAGQRDEWLKQVLASQDEDGYIGCYRPEVRWQYGFEIWSQDRMLQALLYEYEVTGDPEILDACVRAGRCLAEHVTSGDFAGVYARIKTEPGPYQAGHSLNVIHPLLALYEYTGDEKLRDAAVEIYRDYDSCGHSFTARAFLTRDNLRAHIVTVCEHLSIPAKIHAFTDDRMMLDASLRGYELLKGSYQVTGTPSGNEFTFNKGPRKYTEHCGVIEWAISCHRLLLHTGEVRFADEAERAMVNAYWASKSPDGVTLCYNHAPNQVVATNWSGPYEDNWDQGMFRNHYSMVHDPRCCNANTSRGFPNFVEGAVVDSEDGGVAFVYYGPWEVETELPDAGRVRFVHEGDYPFEDAARITIELDETAAFPLHFRIPGWCRSASMTVNGAEVDVPLVPGMFATVEREWSSGDVVELAFDVPVELEWYEESHHSVPGVAVVRGALTYTLPIPERWEHVGPGKPGAGNLEEAWNVVPDGDALWNVALELDVDRPERSFELVRLDTPADALPWQSPPVGLKAKARRVRGWATDTVNGKPQTPSLPPPPLGLEDEVRDVTLVPFGFTHLHMTFLRVVGMNETRGLVMIEGKAGE